MFTPMWEVPVSVKGTRICFLVYVCFDVLISVYIVKYVDRDCVYGRKFVSNRYTLLRSYLEDKSISLSP